ncbi:hypothetical protein RU639_003472 [Aspergillus parasiticus]
MARTAGVIGPFLRPLPGSRSTLLRRLATAPETNFNCAEIDTMTVVPLDNEFVVLLGKSQWDCVGLGGLEDLNDPDKSPMEHSSDMCRVYKTTAIYEQLAKDRHPRLVRFNHGDPVIRVPILEMPFDSIELFLKKYGSMMYDNDEARVLPRYRRLIYQWALHSISGLSFVHSRDIIMGDLRVEICWLAKDLSLSLLGFLDAVYTPPGRGQPWINEAGRYEHEPFHPCNNGRGRPFKATAQTDIFVWGCLIFELMTGAWPGHEHTENRHEIRARFVNRQWPVLEKVYLGDIIQKCWDYGYRNAEELKEDLVQLLVSNDETLEVDGDEIRGFRATELFQEIGT